MVFGERPDVVVENEEIPKVPFSVVVAVPAVKVELVAQANPRTVEEAFPSEVIDPLRIMDEVATEVGTEVVIVGGEVTLNG